jgi:hypothetical protein
MRKLTIILFSIICIYSCDRGAKKRRSVAPSNLQTYFYSLNESEGRKVYCYNYKMGKKSFTSYEVLWTENIEGKHFLHLEAYAPTLKPTDYFVFELNDTGVYLKSHIQRKNEPQVPQEYESEIISNTVLKWKEFNKCTLEYHNGYHDAIRVREYIGETGDITFNGKQYKAIKYMDKMSYEKHLTPEKSQLERTAIYCKGIGQYSCIYKYDDGRVFEKELKEIISYEDWQKRK